MKEALSPLDRDIAAAMAALDRTVPEGHWDELATRVLARVDEEAAGARLAASPVIAVPVAAAAAPPVALIAAGDDHESSGLHDIKALASTAKRRLSSRQRSQHDDAMLLSTPRALGAVALPGSSQRTESSDRGRSPRPTTLDREDARSNTTFWIVGAIATMAAAAAVAVFVFGIGRGPGGLDEAGETVASGPASEAEVVARAERADPAAAPEGRFAAPPPPAATPVASGDSAASRAALDAAKPQVAESVAGGMSEARTGAGDGRARRERKAKKADQKADRGAPGQTATVEQTTSDPPKGTATGAEDPAAPPPAPEGQGGDVSLEDMLDVAAEAKPGTPRSDDKKPEPKEEAGPPRPEKKDLDRRDVTKALGEIHAAVRACRELEKFDGTVVVKFVVAPSGGVTSAEATAARKGTATGNCVAAAVRRARFPAFDGVPTSFHYPFLLAE